MADEPRAPLKIAVVFGTRPEAIKLAPLVRRLRDDPRRLRCVVIVTAQHRHMLDQVLDLFSIRPEYDLEIIRPNQTLAGIMAGVITRLDPVLAHEQPDYVVVQGDTSSTFAGALAAFYQRIPIAHVEAGLRTREKYYPFPEEMNRRLTSVVTDAHFAPTEAARENLLAEGVPREKIWVTGNTVVDTLHDVLSWNKPCSHPVLDRIRTENLRMLLVTTHRRENQGPPQERICDALVDILERFPDVLVVFPVHRSPPVRDTVFPRLGKKERVVLLDPLDYFDMVHFMKASCLILTDSGGIQEEAPSLGRPVLVLRNTTERPEAVEAGTARLIGTDTRRIVDAATELLEDPGSYARMSEIANPFGDGKACERILQALDFLAGRAESPMPFRAGRLE